MGEDLVSVVLARASADPTVSDDVELLLLAALESDAALADVLDADHPVAQLKDSDPEGASSRAFLSSITVEGFRGVGDATRLEFAPAPGLVVVAGRNGSGKSSFADALEVALTRDSYRWRNRPPLWRGAWRNLHHPAAASVRVDLAEEGEGVTTVGVDWAAEAGLGEMTAWTQRPGAKREAGLEGLGWQTAIERFRPFLSYQELEAVCAQPSTLYEALDGILGLERLDDADGRLQKQGKRLGEHKERAAALARELKSAAAGLTDERAIVVAAELKRHKPHRIRLARLAAGDRTDDQSSELSTLRALADLTVLDDQALAVATDAYTTAVESLAEPNRGGGDAARRRADLLVAALSLHDEHGDGPCPVCGRGSLDAEWASRVRAELATDTAIVQARNVRIRARDQGGTTTLRVGDSGAGSRARRRGARHTGGRGGGRLVERVGGVARASRHRRTRRRHASPPPRAGHRAGGACSCGARTTPGRLATGRVAADELARRRRACRA
jgi:AAA domain